MTAMERNALRPKLAVNRLSVYQLNSLNCRHLGMAFQVQVRGFLAAFASCSVAGHAEAVRAQRGGLNPTPFAREAPARR